MNILAIETSCDETSVSILQDKKILSNIISSQLFHSEWGGVVPEIASREHIKNVTRVCDEAIKKSGISKDELELVCATSAPGLIGALLVGYNFAKSFAFARGLPFVPVNHIQSHLYSVFIENDFRFPFLGLIVSGGHTLLVLVEDFFKHKILGFTLDDAAGEAFDKGAKVLGLGYPGGPLIDRLAKTGDRNFHQFPIAKTENEFDFSFSGIKTSLLNFYNKNKEEIEIYQGENNFGVGVDGNKNVISLNDICASYQETIIEMLFKKTFRAAEKFNVKTIGISGGVSANSRLKERFNSLKGNGFEILIPSLEYTIDNAAMIGFTGYLKYEKTGEKEYFKGESFGEKPTARLDYARF